MSEINKSRLESVLMLKKISFKEIDNVINCGGDEENSFKFESLLKGNNPIPKNVERKVLDYLLVEKNLDIKRYVYNETDDIDFEVKHNTKVEKKPSRKVNIFGATTKDVAMSDAYIANHINRKLAKDRYKELGFTGTSLLLFFNEECSNKFFADLISSNKRKYLTKEESNNIGYLLETKYTSLVTGTKKHNAVTKYNVPEYAKYYISLDDEMVCPKPVSDEFETLRKKLKISKKLLQNILENDFPVGIKFAELFIEAYNSVFDTKVTFNDIIKEFDTKKDLFYDDKAEEIYEMVIPSTEESNTKIDIDIDNLPESWKQSIKEPVKKEELIEENNSTNEETVYSCKCGHIKSNTWKSNQLCPECNTIMRRAGWYDNEPTVEKKKEADKIIEEVVKEVEMSPEYLINYIDEHFNSLIMDKMISVLQSKSKAKYNLEVADKLMDELNKAYNYANSNS